MRSSYQSFGFNFVFIFYSVTIWFVFICCRRLALLQIVTITSDALCLDYFNMLKIDKKEKILQLESKV